MKPDVVIRKCIDCPRILTISNSEDPDFKVTKCDCGLEYANSLLLESDPFIWMDIINRNGYSVKRVSRDMAVVTKLDSTGTNLFQ